MRCDATQFPYQMFLGVIHNYDNSFLLVIQILWYI